MSAQNIQSHLEAVVDNKSVGLLQATAALIAEYEQSVNLIKDEQIIVNERLVTVNDHLETLETSHNQIIETLDNHGQRISYLEDCCSNIGSQIEALQSQVSELIANYNEITAQLNSAPS